MIILTAADGALFGALRTKFLLDMPVDPISIAGAASNILPSPSDYFNVGSTLLTNRQNQKFSEKMYDRQYRDIVDFWGLQNEYNSPRAQMQRFQEAGLNPHLIYGQGNPGNASSLSVPDVVPVNRREPRLEGGRPDVLAVLLGQADLRIKNAQATNLETQTDLIRADIAYKNVGIEQRDFDLGFSRDMRDTQADFRREALRKIRTDVDLSINENVRRELQNAVSVQEATERIKTLIEQRKAFPLDRQKTVAETRHILTAMDNLVKDGVMKDLDIELKRVGINPGSPVWATVMGRIFVDGLSGKNSGFSLPREYQAGTDEVSKIIRKILSYF